MVSCIVIVPVIQQR